MALRVGLLGGSFNPVHVGHLALGRAAVDAFALDRMIVMPTGNSWQKAGTTHAKIDAAHRLAMVRIALAAPAGSRPKGCEWVADDLEV